MSCRLGNGAGRWEAARRHESQEPAVISGRHWRQRRRPAAHSLESGCGTEIQGQMQEEEGHRVRAGRKCSSLGVGSMGGSWEDKGTVVREKGSGEGGRQPCVVLVAGHTSGLGTSERMPCWWLETGSWTQRLQRHPHRAAAEEKLGGAHPWERQEKETERQSGRQMGPFTPGMVPTPTSPGIGNRRLLVQNTVLPRAGTLCHVEHEPQSSATPRSSRQVPGKGRRPSGGDTERSHIPRALAVQQAC